jgi:hypothetical protein
MRALLRSFRIYLEGRRILLALDRIEEEYDTEKAYSKVKAAFSYKEVEALLRKRGRGRR